MALADYLLQRPLALPVVIDHWTGGCIGDAVLRPGFARGALLLRGSEGGMTRLSWGEIGVPGDARRALAPGRYEVLGVRWIEHDAQGVEWIASATGVGELELEPEEELLFTPEPLELSFDPGTVPFEGVDFALRQGPRGVALYRAGRRIELSYVLRAADGSVRARGPLDYG